MDLIRLSTKVLIRIMNLFIADEVDASLSCKVRYI